MSELRSQWRVLVMCVAACCLLYWAPTAYANDLTSRELKFDIPAQALSSAIIAFSEQTGVQVITSGAQVTGLTTAGVSGKFSIARALERLLNGTGLKYEAVGSTAVALTPNVGSGKAPGDALDRGAGRTLSDPIHSVTSVQVQKDTTSEVKGGPSDHLEEIVVTAQKRAERQQDVPIPLTVVNTEALVSSGQLRIQDYYQRIPGLTVAPDDFGAATVTIRGISTGDYTNPTVAITVDDIPFGSSTALGNGPEVPDFDPSDLSHLEVLRGPQGTLYGASSLGGLIKYVTVDPSTEAFSARVEGDVNDLSHGDGVGYGARAAANIPLNDSLAVRLSGFARRDAGYVDNILTGQRGVNWGNVEGGRLSALWHAAPGVSLKLSAWFEDTTTHGSANVELGPGSGALVQSNVRNIGGFEKRIQAYSANLSADLGWAQLKSLSGYSINEYRDSFDFSSGLGGLVESGIPGTGFDGYGVSGAPIFVFGKTNKFTQELRLASPGGGKLDWLAGVFFNHEDSPATENILAAAQFTGVSVATFANIVFPSTFAEYAGFADLTYHFTDKFELQLGARESQNRQSYRETYTGPYDLVAFGEAGPYVQSTVHSKDNSFTYLVTPQFKISPDVMVYARVASGYRPGGPNINGGSSGLPSVYKPDTTRNYELGLKSALLERTLSIDASLYYIDWQNIQLYLTAPVTDLAYNANGSGAKSEGVELSVESKPLAGMTIAAWVAGNRAVLRQSFPSSSSALGFAGDRLPYSSRFSGSVSIDQEMLITNGLSGVVGGTVSYVGDREGVFAAAGGPNERQDFPAYTKVDLRAGIKWDGWSVSAFANNLTDRRGLLNGGLNTYNPAVFVLIPPRTIGLSVARSF